jgi:hypothetical protein
LRNSGVIKDSKVYTDMSAEFAQACDFKFVTLQWHTPVPGLGPELCHDRGLACLAFPLARPWDCVGVTVTVALGVSSVMVSGLACGSGTRAPLWPILPSTDTRAASVVLRVKVLRSTHNPRPVTRRCPARRRWPALGTTGPPGRARGSARVESPSSDLSHGGLPRVHSVTPGP